MQEALGEARRESDDLRARIDELEVQLADASAGRGGAGDGSEAGSGAPPAEIDALMERLSSTLSDCLVTDS